MSFAGINYLAVFVAAIAGFRVGGVLFGERWMKAAGISSEDMNCEDGSAKGAAKPMIIAGIADLILAWMLAELSRTHRGRWRSSWACWPLVLSGWDLW